MANTRLIDTLPVHSRRAKELQVLCLGFSRTGTLSLKKALIKLGYRPYHMSEALIATIRRERHLQLWDEALKAKFEGQGKPFTQEDFDKFLGDFDVLEDIPSILFADEFLAMYPNAKVILTNRDVTSWLASMDKTFSTILTWKTLPFLCARDPVLWGPYVNLVNKIMAKWTKGDPRDREALRETFLEHYQNVRSRVPKEKLLEFKSQDGWGPLCKFLGKPAPEEPYPRANDAQYTVKLHNYLYWATLWKLYSKLGAAFGVGCIATGVGYWLYG
ncbi:NAD dependent epimerase/dehydratase [Lindgomyces ingoldianus]|uniref:NAD dependent epimerase/dehydratase n=1 Tax=Lindgomyces ingoldianus TaxID=673940 RepID=A0ACB6R3X5_9PLEO|nr:NAD dependent epimerase/dehydratase [Lindgomyces ingoldianus]KAF2473762.1 NAD dependent epimerase/dehydratase [Lindgomyces ingoldianus]